jgi:hypothetical protein
MKQLLHNHRISQGSRCLGLLENHDLQTVLPALLQVLAYASKAVWVLSPQIFLIAACTLEESVPQRVGRSAGLWKVLENVLGNPSQLRTRGSYLRAAKRHAGGVATAT